MIKTFVLVVISFVHSGGHVSFQEFHSLQSCQKNAVYLNGKSQVSEAYCTEK